MKEQNTTLVSVILPTCDREATLKASIESILNQTYDNLELIVVDDASTDGTEKLVRSIRDERIKYIYNVRRLGAAGARNKGIMISKGDYIAFNDSDDEWVPDKLEKQLPYMEGNTGMVFSTYTYDTVEGEREMRFPEFFQEASNEELKTVLSQRNIIGTCMMLIRRECLEQVGLFDSEMPRHQDYELSIRLVQKFPVRFIDEPLVRVHHGTGCISDDDDALFKAVILMLKKHGDFFEERDAVEAHMLLGLRKCSLPKRQEGYSRYLSLLMKELGDKYKIQIVNACAAALRELAEEKNFRKEESERLRSTLGWQLKKYVNRITKGEGFYIYGAGVCAIKLCRILFRFGPVSLLGFIVSDRRGNGSELEGYPVQAVTEIGESGKDRPVIIAAAEKYHSEIMNTLAAFGFHDFLPVMGKQLEELWQGVTDEQS